MAAQFTHTQIVQFADTDVAGIVHFANFYRWMEEAEHAYLRSLGFSVMQQQPDGTVIGFPRVSASCRFEAPAFFEDELTIDVNLLRRGVKSLTFGFEFHRGKTRIAAGEIKTACCICQPGGKLKSIEIPPRYCEKLVEATP
jgi:YbgC/YbaW family acyl-CoA thioester hydrolase